MYPRYIGFIFAQRYLSSLCIDIDMHRDLQGLIGSWTGRRLVSLPVNWSGLEVLEECDRPARVLQRRQDATWEGVNQVESHTIAGSQFSHWSTRERQRGAVQTTGSLPKDLAPWNNESVSERTRQRAAQGTATTTRREPSLQCGLHRSQQDNCHENLLSQPDVLVFSLQSYVLHRFIIQKKKLCYMLLELLQVSIITLVRTSDRTCRNGTCFSINSSVTGPFCELARQLQTVSILSHGHLLALALVRLQNIIQGS